MPSFTAPMVAAASDVSTTLELTCRAEHPVFNRTPYAWIFTIVGKGKSRLTGSGFDTCRTIPGATPRNAHHFSFDLVPAPVSIGAPQLVSFGEPGRVGKPPSQPIGTVRTLYTYTSCMSRGATIVRDRTR